MVLALVALLLLTFKCHFDVSRNVIVLSCNVIRCTFLGDRLIAIPKYKERVLCCVADNARCDRPNVLSVAASQFFICL